MQGVPFNLAYVTNPEKGEQGASWAEHGAEAVEGFGKETTTCQNVRTISRKGVLQILVNFDQNH
jgi:hypothetical protein